MTPSPSRAALADELTAWVEAYAMKVCPEGCLPTPGQEREISLFARIVIALRSPSPQAQEKPDWSGMTTRAIAPDSSAAPADGWQPIETAPKQGCIEARNINGDQFCVWWNDAAFKGFPIRGGVFCVPHLTHWRHAPEAESRT